MIKAETSTTVSSIFWNILKQMSGILWKNFHIFYILFERNILILRQYLNKLGLK